MAYSTCNIIFVSREMSRGDSEKEARRNGILSVAPVPYVYTQVNKKIESNLEREYWDCIKSRRDKVGITRHIMMHQVLYNVHVTLFIGQLHNI